VRVKKVWTVTTWDRLSTFAEKNIEISQVVQQNYRVSLSFYTHVSVLERKDKQNLTTALLSRARQDWIFHERICVLLTQANSSF